MSNQKNTELLAQYTRQLEGLIALYSAAPQEAQTDAAHSNRRCYEPFLPENYAFSYANPDFCASCFGEAGGLLSAVFCQTLIYKDYVFEGNGFAHEMAEYLRSFCAMRERGELTAQNIRRVMHAFSFGLQKAQLERRIVSTYCSDFHVLTDILMNSDLQTPHYLYRLNMCVTEEEKRLSAHVAKLPQPQIDDIASLFVDGYLRAYPRNGMERAGRCGMGVVGIAGMERFTRALILEIRKRGFKPFVSRIEGTIYNQQMLLDHKADDAAYLAKAHADAYQRDTEALFAKHQNRCEDYSGTFHFTSFGKEAVPAESCAAKLVYTTEQAGLHKTMTRGFFRARESVIPEKNRNFSIIGFPRPSIHAEFEAVFDWFVKINSLKNDEYEAIQQRIIDALDEGEYVRVKGAGDNETDMRVMLQPLDDRKSQTGFFNCGADDNIPVGEVFTTPQLKGTGGLLHVGEVYLDDIKYKDLKIAFEDGYVTGYSCANDKDTAQGVQLIKDNLMFPHDTLPLGEFAIGTNTLAYAVAKRYGIVQHLNILITEKMGPHFAIGDTCYAMIEDISVYNPDGKEVVAKDNAHSALRHTDEDAAYTDVHTDITLPFGSVGAIVVVKADGQEIAIVRDGRFVLAGTAPLNDAMK